jgi:zinc protease
MPEIGQTISHYRITKKLGQGGMGEVYKAEDLILSRSVALKILPARLVEDPDRVRRFVNEAKASSALNHPHIVTIYEIGRAQADGKPEPRSESDIPGQLGATDLRALATPAGPGTIYYIAMEFLDGVTLHVKIHQQEENLKKLLGSLTQAADGLAKAHVAGIIHRDLKPENIMITEDGYAKILDFGLAKLVESEPPTGAAGSNEIGEAATAMTEQTRPGMVMGTVGYMSPEQVQGQPLDQRSDIFSFGCILYEAATRKRPFAGDSMIDSLHKIVYTQIPSIVQSNPQAPAELQRIVRKCLAKEPAGRYQSTKDLANDLRELVKEFDSQPLVSDGHPQPAVVAVDAQAPTIEVPSKASVPDKPAGIPKTAYSVPVSRGTLGRLLRKRSLWIGAGLGLIVIAVAAVALLKLSLPSYDIPISQYTLKNGLRVVLSEDHAAPTYSLCITYNAGSRDECPGHSGIAHFAEHLMFQGSENVGKMEHATLIENNGGNFNAAASYDITTFFETLPSNQLELGLFLESDRMRALTVNQADFDNQRQIILQELALYENQLNTKMMRILMDVAYDNFAYKHFTYGSPDSVNAATPEELNDFHKAYYGPNNAALTLVGDFDTQNALSKIKKYFEAISSQTAPKLPNLIDPPQKAERRKIVEDELVQTPTLYISYKTATGNTADENTLSVLSDILGSGQSCRLYQSLVKDKEILASASAGTFDARGSCLLMLNAVAKPGKDLAQVEKSVYEEISRIKDEPVADAEIDRARLQWKRARVRSLQSTLSRATLLGQYAVNYSDPSLINTEWDKIEQVDAAEIQRVARAYLNESNRSVVIAMPKAKAARPQVAAAGVRPQPALSQPAGNAPTASRASNVERKNRAPISSAVPQVKMPHPVEEVLDNGLTLSILEDHRLPSVTVSITVWATGQIFEPGNLPGLADTTASMLLAGTKSRTSKQIAEEIGNLGATISASASFGSTATNLSASGLSDGFDKWFPMVLDVLLKPTFPVDELNSLKQRTKVNLQQQRVAASSQARELFYEALFGQHPAAVQSATAESLAAITPALLTKWHQEHYQPQNTIVGIVGDVSARDLLPRLKTWLGSWQRQDLNANLPPNPAPAAAKKIYLIHHHDSPQATIIVGNIAVDRRSPDYIPMVVVNRVLGEGSASRLFLNLRERNGYAYSANSQFSAMAYPGAWLATTEVRTEVVGAAVGELLGEIRRINEEKVPDEELAERKRAASASFALSLEQPSQLLNYSLTRLRYGFSADYWDTYAAKIMGVSADDIQRVARTYLNPDALQIVVVGDAARIKAALEKYGPVELSDAQASPPRR